jgi:hypothetical protein
MKNLILFSFLLLVISCGDDAVENNSVSCTEVEYKIEFDLSLNEEICFPDGNSIILKDVKHQLCPCDAVCDDEGDLLIVLETNSILDVDKKEFFTRAVFTDAGIFSNHEIIEFSFTYGSEDEEVPACAADFEPEKMKLTFVISEI